MKTVLVGLTFLLLTSIAFAQSNGTWELYPPQSQSYSVSVDPPIKADGSSVFANNSTIPVQYDVAIGYGQVVFASYQSGSPAFSYLAFTPNSATYIDDLTTLSSVYQFQTGNCYGGSPRWSIELMNGDVVYAYYGSFPSFNECVTNYQGGSNLLDANFRLDQRFEIQGGAMYVPWSTILTTETGQQVKDVVLVLDGGWAGNQVFATGYPQNVTVGTASWTAVFTPQTGTTPTCPSAPATIQVTMVSGPSPAIVNSDLIDTPADSGSSFRIVDCKYMYNLSAKGLLKGTYKVDAIVNGSPATQTAPGTGFTIK